MTLAGIGGDRVNLVVVHRVVLLTLLFLCALGAHVALPQLAAFALVLAGLTASAALVLHGPDLRVPVSQPRADRVRRDAADAAFSGDWLDETLRGAVAVPRDADLAGIEAELHTLVDQFRTELASSDALDMPAPGAAGDETMRTRR